MDIVLAKCIRGFSLRDDHLDCLVFYHYQINNSAIIVPQCGL